MPIPVLLGALAVSIIGSTTIDAIGSIQDMSSRKKYDELRAKKEVELFDAQLERYRAETRRLRREHLPMIDIEPSAQFLEMSQYGHSSQSALPYYSSQSASDKPLTYLDMIRARNQFQSAQMMPQSNQYYPSQTVQPVPQCNQPYLPQSTQPMSQNIPYSPMQIVQNLQKSLSELERALDTPINNGMTLRQLIQCVPNTQTQSGSTQDAPQQFNL